MGVGRSILLLACLYLMLWTWSVRRAKRPIRGLCGDGCAGGWRGHQWCALILGRGAAVESIALKARVESVAAIRRRERGRHQGVRYLFFKFTRKGQLSKASQILPFEWPMLSPPGHPSRRGI